MATVGGYDPSAAIRAALQADPCVRTIELTGSRAQGTATDLSDWDYRVVSADPVATAGQLPGLIATLNPLAALWDPLSSEQVYMIILSGAVKADLFPACLLARQPARRRKSPPRTCAQSTRTSGTGRFGWAPNGCADSTPLSPPSWPRCGGTCSSRSARPARRQPRTRPSPVTSSCVTGTSNGSASPSPQTSATQ